MADVRARFDGDSDRGQLLLVTALALAVMLVTVALLLNTAIFTENVATRDTTADGSEAIELRGEAVDAVGELIEAENRGGGGDPGDVDTAVDAMGPLVDRERARHGTVATLSRNGSATAGQLLRWDESGDPRAFGEYSTNWTFAEGIDNARGFRLTVEPSELEPATAATSDTDAMGVRFINSTGDNVTYYLYEDGSDTLSVAEAVDGSTPTRQCSIEHDGTTTVGFTASQLSTNGASTDCFRALWPPNSPDEIRFVNVGSEEGTAEVTADSVSSWGSGVYENDAVYSVTVDITYQSQDLLFETTVRVAPGEPQ
ncbi:DUF7261 family protein [Halohasta litorea]|uniref:Flagellin n=1 Tax=Halohasta litorea TaxID=869891 RepID=A0ABD6D6J8_9EURY|nr:hypothetical protein [Halohasta litorea]